jgi:glycosyltransferase involved in cell wall biosynthesis
MTGLSSRASCPAARQRGATSNARAFVLPSRVEPFGIVVLEAMHAGTPVVVSVHGGATEIVQDRVTGLVVDPFDAQALADALERAGSSCARSESSSAPAASVR